MSTSYWLDRTSKSKAREFDAVIVGGGVSGLSTAFWLLKEDPTMKVAIIEKHRLAFGASGRNAGFITGGSVEHFNRMINKHGLEQATDIWRFAQENLRMLKDMVIQDKGAELSFEQHGAYSLAAQDNEFDELVGVTKIMDQLNIRTQIYEGKELVKTVGAHGFKGGIRYLDDGAINPVALVHRLRELVNVELFEGVEAYGIEEAGDMRALKTDQGDFIAPMILLNLNGYSSSLHPWFADKIYPTRGQCLMMEPVPRFMDAPCYANFYLDYFRQLPSGHLLIGGFRQVEKATEVGYSDHITDGIQNALHEFVVTHLPQFKDKKVSHRWSGVMGFAKDGEPMVGSIPDDPQIFFAGGYTAHGIGLSFNTTKKLVDLVFGREVPKWLSARRFN